jgi:tight adherence protein B
MRQPLFVAIVLVALGCLVGAASAAISTTAAQPRLIEAGGARFPDRAFVLRLPARKRVGAGQIQVLENGAPVSNVSIVPAARGRQTDFGVVLVIDASNSMRGRAISDATAAARVFAGRRSPGQQLAVVTFNERVSVLLPFTTDAHAIDAALAKPPPLAKGTHIYDGVAAALRLLRNAKIAAGSVIVLSDGADTGSRLSAARVAATARTDHVRIFSVGIRSASFRSAPLQRLAFAAGGDFSATRSTADLARIYDQLGAQLSSEYLLRYRSHAGPSVKIRVVARIKGVQGAAVSGYVTPRLPRIPGAEPYHRPFSEAFWQSWLTMLVFSLLAAAGFALGVLTIVRPRRGSLRRRMAHFVSIGSSREGSDDLRLAGKMLGGAERSLETTKWWARFVETLELAEIRMPGIQLLMWTFVGTLFSMWLLAVLGGSIIFGLLGLGVPFGVRTWITRKVAKKRALFAEQLPDNLQVLASALRAGHSLVGALSVVVDDAAEPSRTEFKRVVADEQLGVPLEKALDVVVGRMANNDLEQVGLVAALQRQTGGNMAEVLDRVTETIRERAELRRMVQTLTAQGRMSRWVVSLIPVVLLLAISALNPRYVEPLFTETVGRVLLVFAAVMVVGGSFVIKKIVDIKL